MRVLVAFESIRSVYADVITRSICELRSGLNVRSAILEELEQDLGDFAPHVVVCNQPKSMHASVRGAWVEIPTEEGLEDEEKLARICLDGEQWRTDGPQLAELLEILQRVAAKLTCPRVDATSAYQTGLPWRPQICIMRCGSCPLKPAVDETHKRLRQGDLSEAC